MRNNFKLIQIGYVILAKYQIGIIVEDS